MIGVVYLVGAGPGDPGLITVRGAALLARAEVIVYDGLVSESLLDRASRSAVCIYAGKKRAVHGQPLTQAQINELLVRHARAGKCVVRLKGGDPFVFGRGAEECRALVDAGIDFEVVPGVTSATAVAAYAGIPLTARGLTSTVSFATGHEAAGKPSTDVDWHALAHAGTIVLFMAVRTMAECCAQLISAGKRPDTPAAVIQWGTTASQRQLVATLAELPAAARAVNMAPPALIVVGEVATLASALSWRSRRPLDGVRVALTRGPERGNAMARAITECGGQPVFLPVTSVAPMEFEPPDPQALERCDWLLFTSAHSVVYFLDSMLDRGQDARALVATRIACVGGATARALRERGLIADVIPERGDSTGLAHAVARVAGSAIQGANVLFPRALHGRDEAVLALRAAGAAVTVMPVYQTVRVSEDRDPVLQRGLRRLRAGQVQALAFLAPSQVDALFDLLKDQAVEVVRACSLVAAIGNTTQAALTRRGLDVHVVPPKPDPEALVTAISAHWHARTANHQDVESTPLGST